MTRASTLLVATLVVLAALVGAVGQVGAADAATATAGPAATASATPATSAATAQANCSFPVTRTDSTGTNVTVAQSPEDVVVLGASNAQTIWELGEQERVVGMPVGPSTAYLNGSADRTHVLDGTSVRTETVVDLDPDLVVGPGGEFIAEDDVEALRDAGITVYVQNDGSSLDDVRDRVTTTGRFLGACSAADETLAWMDEQLAVVEEATQDVERPSLYYFLGGTYTAGSGTFQGDLVVRAGADNAAANIGIEGWGQVESESLVAEDPQYVLVTEGTTIPDGHVLQETTALREENVVTVDTNYWNQAAPRVVLAVQNITRQLHPEAYEQATSSSDGNETTGSADGAGTGNATESSGSDDGADGGDSDGSPGFGVPVAVAALVASLLALRRRT